MHRTRHQHRTPDRQLDLFAARLPSAPDAMPAWSSLPDRTRQTVTGLMTSLLVGHVAIRASTAGATCDER